VRAAALALAPAELQRMIQRTSQLFGAMLRRRSCGMGKPLP